MPTIKGSDNTTEGNKRLEIVHDIVSLKRYSHEVNIILAQLNNECFGMTDSSLNDRLQNYIHSLKSINSMMIAKVNDIISNMHYKTAEHLFYLKKRER